MSAQFEANLVNTILVVEDDFDSRQVLELLLRRMDLNPVCVVDGEQALTWLDAHQPDLIVLDWMLPGMSGLEICQRIRQRWPANILPILMLSALGYDPEDRLLGLQAGANDFMAKPYHPGEFAVRARALLKSKQEIEQVQTLLNRYVHHEILEQGKSKLISLNHREYRHAVVMFADLRGFTKLSQQMASSHLITILDQFFDMMFEVIKQYGGVPIDLTGDELLAVFNIPYDLPLASHLAVEASAEMQIQFKTLQQNWLRAGFEMGLGIGIHQGQVSVGNVGSAELMRYTVIGSVVNIAHRLVEIAQPGEILASMAVMSDVAQSIVNCKVLQITKETLKGIDESLSVFHLSVSEPSTSMNHLSLFDKNQ
jgi:adenylate cyclase